MIPLQNPSRITPVDTAGLANLVAYAGKQGDDRRNQVSDQKALGAYIDTLYGGSPQGLSSLVPTTPRQPSGPPDAATQRVGAAFGDTSDNPGVYRDAIAGIESAGSGDYNAVGPTHPKYGRALGRYQVMEANIPAWSQEVLGRPVTAEEFLANPDIQDKIFDAKFGQAVQKYGNPEDAASVWFTGQPQAQGGDKADVLGTTGNAYVQKFKNAIGRGGSAPMPTGNATAAPQAASSGGDLLPPREIMQALIASPGTRPIALALAQSAAELRMNNADPKAQLAYRKSLLELQKLENGEWDKLDDGSLYNKTTGETRTVSGPAAGGAFRFKGNSVEAQALNGMMDNGMPANIAQELATGKTVTGPNGEIIFMSGSALMGRPIGGGPAVPVDPATLAPAGGGGGAPAPVPQPAPTQQQSGAVTITGPKVNAEQVARKSKVDASLSAINDELTRFEELTKEGGISVAPGKQRDNLNAVRQGIMLQAKELFNLGVLNGPDLSLMEKMIYDPVVDVTKEGGFLNLPGQIWSGATGDAGDRAANSVKELRRMFESVRQGVEKSMPGAGGSGGGIVDFTDYFKTGGK